MLSLRIFYTIFNLFKFIILCWLGINNQIKQDILVAKYIFDGIRRQEKNIVKIFMKECNIVKDSN